LYSFYKHTIVKRSYLHFLILLKRSFIKIKSKTKLSKPNMDMTPIKVKWLWKPRVYSTALKTATQKP
jgi:hypothetical protein